MAKGKKGADKTPNDVPSLESGMKRIVSLNKLRAQQEKTLKEKEAEVRVHRNKLTQIEEQIYAAIDEESTPNLFAPGISVTDEDIAHAAAEVDAAAEKPKEKKISAADEAWRKDSIDTLNLPARTAELLKGFVDGEAPTPIDTLGKLADMRDRLGEIKGLGKKQVKQIEDALTNYFTAHEVPQPAAAGESTDGGLPD